MVNFTDFAIDYTPCVTNTSILEVYKNFKYKINPDREVKDQHDAQERDEYYKTNTRVVILFEDTLVQLSATQKKVNTEIRMKGISIFLLYTRDLSQKWSCEALFDKNRMINNPKEGILTKMGFVNIICIKKIDVRILQNVVLSCNLRKQLVTPSDFLSDVQNPISKLPIIMLNSSFAFQRDTEMNIHISDLCMGFCHDSVLGLILLCKSAGVHLGKAVNDIVVESEGISQVEDPKDVLSCISEESDDQPPSKSLLNINRPEEEKEVLQDYDHNYLERESDFCDRRSLEIIDEPNHKFQPLLEEPATLYEPFQITEDYFVKVDKRQNIESKWHSISLPKTTKLPVNYQESSPSLKLSLKVRT